MEVYCSPVASPQCSLEAACVWVVTLDLWLLAAVVCLSLLCCSISISAGIAVFAQAAWLVRVREGEVE